MRALCAALLLGGGLAAFVSSCKEAPPSGGPPAPAAPPPPRFWLVDTTIASAPRAEPARTIQGPVLVELLPGGKVRSAPEASEAFEGFIPEATTKSPADRRGLMLYGQTASELHLDSPSGPVMGRIHPGALVSVAPEGEAAWLVAVPRYDGSNAGDKPPLLAYVEKTALGPTPKTQAPPAIPGRLVRDFPFPVWTSADPSRNLVSRLLCGEFHVTEGEGRARISQYYDGIELTGVLDSSWYWGDRGESTCLGRLVFQRDEELREGRGKRRGA